MTTDILDFNEDYDNLMISKNNQEVQESAEKIKVNLRKDEERKMRRTMTLEINKLEGIDLKEYEYPSYEKTIFIKEPEVRNKYKIKYLLIIIKMYNVEEFDPKLEKPFITIKINHLNDFKSEPLLKFDIESINDVTPKQILEKNIDAYSRWANNDGILEWKLCLIKVKDFFLFYIFFVSLFY